MRHINSILGNGETLADLFSQSREIVKLQYELRNKLGKPVSEHVYLASINPEVLTLYTDTAAWAARLRFDTNNILAFIKTLPGYDRVISVRIKIDPSLVPSEQKGNSKQLSSLSAQHLEKVAETIDDPELQSSLLKLAQNR